MRTGLTAAMVKIQQPEYEAVSTGIHAKSDVSCVDCHMPYGVRKGGREDIRSCLAQSVIESTPGASVALATICRWKS